MKYKLIAFLCTFLSLKTLADNTPTIDTTKVYKLQEVEVKGERIGRDLKIIQIPSSISVLNSFQLKNNRTLSLKNVSTLVPNVYAPDYGSKLTTPVFIRGIGSQRGSPAIGLYIDDIPYFEKATFDTDLFGVAQLEVFRGPQGVSYGRNALGGIIYVTTQDPSRVPITEINMEIGNYKQQGLTFNHRREFDQGRWGLVLSGNYLNHEGYFTNHYDGQDVGAMQSSSGRIKLKYKPNDHFSGTLLARAERSKQNGYAYSILTDSTAHYDNVNYNKESFYNRDLNELGLVLKQEKNNYSITNASSLQYYKDNQTVDQDFSPKNFFYISQKTQQYVFTNELTFNYKVNAWESRTGLWFFDQNNDYHVNYQMFKDFFAQQGIPSGDMTQDYFYDKNDWGYALFHESKFSLGKNTISVGFRYDQENCKLAYLNQVSYPKVIPNVDTVFTNNFNNISPKLSFLHQFTPTQSVYAQWAQGYRSGGFNPTRIVDPGDESYDPDQSWNYEVGYKSSWLQGTIQANLACFYIDWSNVLISQTASDGRSIIIANAGEASSYGFEAEVAVYPTEGLQVSTAWGYAKARFDEYIDERKDIDYSGNYLPFTPLYTGSVQVDYGLPIRSQLAHRLHFHAGWLITGKRYWDVDNLHSQASFHTLQANITAHISAHTSITLWGENLLNEQYHIYSFDISSLGNRYTQTGRPLSMGLRVNINF